MGAGYIINDAFDVAKDQLNKPDRVIVDRVFSQKKVKVFYNLMNALAILITLILTYQLSNPGLGTLLLGSIYLLHLYSKFLQRTIVVGNLSIATLCALAIWIIMVAGQTDIARAEAILGRSTEIYFWIFGGFAFLSTLWRELVKDLEDLDGDKQTGLTTLAHIAEGRLSKYFCKLIGLVFCTNIGMILWFFWPAFTAFGIIYGILLLGASCFITWHLFPASEKQDWNKISLWQKIFMVQGILFINFWHGAY